MPKKGIHPTWYPKTKVYCDGQEIMTVSSTKPDLQVDIWSGIIHFSLDHKKLLIQKVEWKGL